MSVEMFTGYFRPADSLSYSFRVFLAQDLSFATVPIILSQLHCMPDFKLGENWRHPISEVTLENGSIRYTYRASSEELTPLGSDGRPTYSSVKTVSLGKPIFDCWNVIKVQEHLNPHYAGGSIRVQLNEKVVFQTKVHIGYNDVIGPFWKFGPYLPVMEGAPDRVVVFYDRIKIGRTRAEVSERATWRSTISF